MAAGITACAWEAARREGCPLLSAAVRPCSEEFTRLSSDYHAAHVATTYREQHEYAEAGTGSAAA